MITLLTLCFVLKLTCFSSAIQYLIEKENGPRMINDLKLINAGKILENNRTLADSRLPVGELPGGLITMHVVVRIPVADKKSGNYVSIFGHGCNYVAHIFLAHLVILLVLLVSS